MKIGLVDEAFKHHKAANYSSEYCHPIKNFEWDRSCNTDFVVFTDRCITQHQHQYTDRIKIAWLLEPRELQPHTYQFVEDNRSDFYDVWSHEQDLCIDPVILAGTWIYTKDWGIYNKHKDVAIVASEKRMLPGHRLRHEIISNVSNIDIYGRKYNPINYKLKTLKPYKYQIVVENIKKEFWFTEKIIDCFLTGTIPIYYGATRINQYFNNDGIYEFDTIENLQKILNNLDWKNKRLQQARIDNFNIAKFYSICENQIYERLSHIKN